MSLRRFKRLVVGAVISICQRQSSGAIRSEHSYQGLDTLGGTTAIGLATYGHLPSPTLFWSHDNCVISWHRHKIRIRDEDRNVPST
ncbi:hypothetical protein FN846DRAFT_229398 [Sphaerosporella brunnea]|uniref:Uncharacterized protein n=1 Tax=Sphaerosporella brunnea TaxID=1250544 RepID=A0A5J5EH21_9PEZI|nr:hypothetical protein FN846DRAFT_364774 [Sphaerosporella brunnea]KAA8897641.1 hypothetical protein FN846DRAFT_229398 [Sphaerosporella brunnea]